MQTITPIETDRPIDVDPSRTCILIPVTQLNLIVMPYAIRLYADYQVDLTTADLIELAVDRLTLTDDDFKEVLSCMEAYDVFPATDSRALFNYLVEMAGAIVYDLQCRFPNIIHLKNTDSPTLFKAFIHQDK